MSIDIGIARAAAAPATSDTLLTDAVVTDGGVTGVGVPEPGATDSLPASPRGSGMALRAALARVVRRPGLVLAVLYVLFAFSTAFVPGLFAAQSPSATDPNAVLSPPSLAHWFGTDSLGRDLWARVVSGSALTIEATVIALAIAIVAGLALGVIAGFLGGWIDAVLMRAVDVLLAIPALLLALAIVTALGFGTVPVAVAVGIAIIPGFARTTRSEVLRVKTLPYVDAARAAGVRTWVIVLRHVLPNSWGPVIVLSVLDVGTAILAIASLSFLGFGAQPPLSEWGSLIADGRAYLVTAPWVSLLPGLFVALVVFSLNHIARSIEGARR